MPSSSSAPSKKKKLGLIARIRKGLYTFFGANDDTPRGIQERKDLYWVVLALTHRKLRMEQQGKLAQTATGNERVVWQEESKEQLQQLIDQAVSHLDDDTDINELSLANVRTQVQTFLMPQILHLLTTAHDSEEKMDAIHGGQDEEDESYELSEKEEQEYKKLLLEEYNTVCLLLKDEGNTNNDGTADDMQQRRTADPMPYYQIKKGAIEWLLVYFDWWPEGLDEPKKSLDPDHVDEFGFQPNNSNPDILPAMRYYHARNLARAALVKESNQSYHSLLPFKSTIPTTRGVFVDGFAPAGTLLAFLPGSVWPKEHLQTASAQTQMQFSLNDPRHQLSMRYDDIMIDSRQSPYTVVRNMWSLGHIINHPPAPTKEDIRALNAQSREGEDGENGQADNGIKHNPLQGPNCVTVPINFTKGMLKDHDERLKDYLPNEYELQPTDWAKSALKEDEVIMHGMGLVALRDLKDEELFYDYRLSPDTEKKGAGQYPTWYYVWDKEALLNRWDMDE